MKTNEVEKLLGITKHTLRYYEKENLIHPIKDENGYRNYSQEDIQTLELIKFLRNIEISIDDIKNIINGQLSFKECLEVNKVYIDHKVEELNLIQKNINNYYEKDIPLIPALAQIKNIDQSAGIGYRKTNNEITLGKKPNKTTVILKWLLSAFLTIIILFYYYVFVTMNTDNTLYILIFTLIPTIYIHFLFFGSNTHFSTLENSQNQSIEFLSDRIHYYKRSGCFNHSLYLYSYLFNKQNKYIKYKRYNEIKKVIIKKNKRYTNVMTPIATKIDSIDFTFIFNDHSDFYFYWPSTYNNEMEMIKIILLNKVTNIDDTDHIFN